MVDIDTRPMSAPGQWQAEQADIDSVVEALEHSHQLSLASRSMFLQIARHGLLTSPDERHEFQVMALSMLSEVLRDTRMGLEHAIEQTDQTWQGARRAEACAREHEVQAKDPILETRADVERARKLCREEN
eukprot:5754725-Amphidinium_carterae.1